MIDSSRDLTSALRGLVPALPRVLAWVLLALPASGQLDLPDQARGDVEGPAPKPTREEPDRAPAQGDSAEEESRSPAQRLLARLAELSDVGAPEVEALARELETLGEPGLVAARQALLLDEGPAVVAGARVLLEGGVPSDRRRVLSRMRERLPGRAIPPLFELLETTRPPREGPEVWLPLLDHPQTSVRARVVEHVTGRAGPEILPHLVPLLAVRRSETREDALRIAAELEGAAVLPVFLDRLDDRSARVASFAAGFLAARDDPRVVPELLVRAVPETRAVGTSEERLQAYALLALVEREDLRGVALLDDRHVPPLLEALRSQNPVLSGAAALALAGIGFRSERPEETSWLDLEVPHELVKIVSGAVFHTDFSSLVTPGVRRLTRLSGRSFGGNGPEWQAWWTRTAGRFRARRAILEALPEDAPRVRVVLEDPRGPSFELRGPALPAPPADSGLETFYLTEREAIDLVGALRREGLFGADRLPGPAEPGGARFAVHLGDGSKVFALPREGVDSWLAAVRDYALALRERNEWQRFADPESGEDRRSFWEVESAWWSGERTEAERERRLAQHVLTWLEALRPLERGPGLDALEEAYGVPGAVQPEHFPRLVSLLTSEVPGSARIPRLTALAVRAGAVDGPLGAPEAIALQEALVPLLASGAPEELVDVFSAAEDEVARAAAVDQRAVVRAAAARALARRSDPASQRGLEALVVDPDEAVATAALSALAAEAAGRPGMIDEGLRERVLELALDARAPVRAEALRVLGEVGGEDAADRLRQGLSALELSVRRAAAEGLARNATLETVPLLLSLLAEGEDPLVRRTAREGLVRLGEPAWPDLLRASHRGRGSLARDAALALAQQGVPEVATTLLARLTEFPGDGEVAWELAVLTCVDHREASDPAAAWWEWWDLVVHDDSRAWLRAGLERVGIPAPSSEALAAGNAAAAEALLQALGSREPALVERARRELSRHLGEALAPPPAEESARRAWLAEAGRRVRERWRTGGSAGR